MVKSRSSLIESSRVDRTAAIERAHSTKMQHRRVVQELICGVVQALMHISQSHMHMDSMNAHTPQRCNIAELICGVVRVGWCL